MSRRNFGKRKRGEAYEGYGYGTQRLLLFTNARKHIENSIANGYFCEAIAVIESIISDRLESRISYITKSNVAFKPLGWLIRRMRALETDEELRRLIAQLDSWRELRNGAIHELPKVERGKPKTSWQDRVANLRSSATDGYHLLRAIYNRVADLNPRHIDRVFDPLT
jgi:hypothetical protein